MPNSLQSSQTHPNPNLTYLDQSNHTQSPLTPSPTLLQILNDSDQSTIEGFLQKRFGDNLAFFASLNPKLYEQLALPPQRYNLFFDQDGINLINLQNHSLIYPKNQNAHTFIPTHQDLASSPLQNPKWTLSHNQLYLQKMDENLFPITGKAINKMIDSLDDLGGVAKFHLPKYFLPNTCIYGALGGLMIQFLLDEGIFFHSLLWFEEEIDFFRIACFFIDFPLLFERCSDRSCYLFIQDLLHRQFITQYFQSHKITNNFLHLELSLYSSPKLENAKAIIKETQAKNSRGWGSFEDEVIGLQNTLKNLSTPTPILHKPKRIDLPICVVGNGSSLDSLLPFIKDNQDKMLILSCGTALKVLKNYGISPDFQVEIERIDYLREVLEDAPLGETPLLAGNMLNPSALNLAKEKYIFMRGGSVGAYLLPSFVLELSSPFVGNAGVAIACAMGSDVILCGLDCGYIEGESKHAQGSYYGIEDKALPQGSFKVQGNHDKIVFSTPIFSLSSSMMSLAISHFKPNLVLNLGDGAYINGSKSAKPQEFDLKIKDKKRAIEEFKRCFEIPQQKVNQKALLDGACDLLDELQSRFPPHIKSKQELFSLIDALSHFCLDQSLSHPSIGTLLEGSICHLLQNLMMACLHYPHNDITPLYRQCLEHIKESFQRYKLKLRLTLNSSILPTPIK